MDFFSREPFSIVNPREMVTSFAPPEGGSAEALFLEEQALITFVSHDFHRIVRSIPQAKPIRFWQGRTPRISRIPGWIVVQSPYGAPGTVLLLEELVAFGVKRAIFLGYCGSIPEGIGIGDV